MHQEEKILFGLLKKEIAAMMMQSYPGIDPEISNWKGQNITDFQEDLRIKVNGQLSEKWFYTHMKGENKSLPRIDVLNILSQYAGYLNWQDFLNSKSGRVQAQEKPLMHLLKIFLILISVMTLVFIIVKMINTRNYRFTFVDSDTGEQIFDRNLHVELLDEDHSTAYFASDDAGSVIIRSNKSRLRMVVKAPYYYTDTIEKSLRKFNRNGQISLNVDYYALMISYFSQSDVSSWERRREQLAAIISEGAIIYQFPDNKAGAAMAIYNKWEFIDKITMPSAGLRKIEILDCRYLDEKISVLRFRIKREKE